MLNAQRSTLDTAGPLGAGPILFVHGTRVTRKMWLPQMEGLAEAYRVIALDLPGHGSLAEEPFGMEAAVREIHAAIEGEGGGRALLVGSSLGGYVSLEFARQQPETVAGLVLSGCCLDLRGRVALPFRAGATLLRLPRERWLCWSHEMLCRGLYPPAYAEPIIAAGFYFSAVPDVLRELTARDFAASLRAYPGPVLFLNGRNDRIFRLHERAFVAAARNGQLQIIPGGTHRCNLEHPRVFTEAIHRFAREIGW